MSQIAVIEITNSTIDLTKIKNKNYEEGFYFDINNLPKLNFFKEENSYINIINELESKELDILIFDYETDLRDYKKIFNIISPLFKAVTYLINNEIEPYNLKLFVSEDCNIENKDFIKVNIECTNIERSFIGYLSSHNIMKTNCFPPIVFSFI